jgi:uncharacterized protein YdiU (UPF0061 family)
MPFPFANTYARLPETFFARVDPTPVRAPRWIALNRDLAAALGLDLARLDSEEGLAYLAGNRLPPGAEPIATVYAGHQFGGFTPRLGDGRAILLGEVPGPDGVRRDIQLKGAGPTPFSRRGDGRSALGPVLREYLVSEAMAALGVPTTRALAAVWSGEPVFREQVEPGGVFTRVARSHLRVGTFEYFASREDRDSLRVLVAYALERHFPEGADAPVPALALLESVIRRQADLVARWMGLGFIHGVMNTDNTSISGETIDYGPCAFVDTYDPDKRFSFIDEGGRYAYGNQPRIALWNLARLAESLLPFLADREDDAVARAGEALDGFAPRYRETWTATFAAKIGIPPDAVRPEEDPPLAASFLDLLHAQETDFTLAFRHLAAARRDDPAGAAPFLALFRAPDAAATWLADWRARLEARGLDASRSVAIMRRANPVFIPRNHRIEEVIEAARTGDFSLFHRLLAVLARPFDEQPEHAAYERPPAPHEVVPATFCGT